MSVATSTLSGAASGAAAGMMFGPWGAAIGSVVGGATGFIKGKKQDETQSEIDRLNKEEEAKQKKAFEDADMAMRRNQSNVQTAQAQTQWFAFGNVGKEDFVMHPKQIMKQMNPISQDGYEIQGNTHEEGGIRDINGNVAEGAGRGTMSGGEVVYNKRVYTRRKKLPNGNTFAEEAKNILKERASLEAERNETIDKWRVNSIDRMLAITDKRLRALHMQQA